MNIPICRIDNHPELDKLYTESDCVRCFRLPNINTYEGRYLLNTLNMMLDRDIRLIARKYKKNELESYLNEVRHFIGKDYFYSLKPYVLEVFNELHLSDNEDENFMFRMLQSIEKYLEFRMSQ